MFDKPTRHDLKKSEQKFITKQ